MIRVVETWTYDALWQGGERLEYATLHKFEESNRGVYIDASYKYDFRMHNVASNQTLQDIFYEQVERTLDRIQSNY